MGAKQQSDFQVTGSHSPVFIRSSTGPWSLNLHGIWENWELLFFLVWRDIKVRYTQTVLGVAWAILQPLAIALAISYSADL
jgi:lipopolysaccharide transport system permease protein